MNPVPRNEPGCQQSPNHDTEEGPILVGETSRDGNPGARIPIPTEWMGEPIEGAMQRVLNSGARRSMSTPQTGAPKMRNPIVWTEPELTYFRRFFDAVDAAMTAEIQAGRSLLEESLTFLLGRLLDGASTFQQILPYTVRHLNSDLGACGTGAQVVVDFTTNEHTKAFESNVSWADLGIVVHREHSVLGPEYTKAVIVQSKKLYPSRDADYGLGCQYGGFNPAQFSELKRLASTHDWDGVAYFLYNPPLEAFNADDQRIMTALEAQLTGQAGWLAGFPYWHPEMEFFLHKSMRGGGWIPLGPSRPESSEEARQRRSQTLAQRPGLRVLGVSSLSDIVESNGKVRSTFSLHDCYQHATSSRWWGQGGSVPFLPLSSYVVDMLLGCTRGTDNERIMAIANGHVPTKDGKAGAHSARNAADEEGPGVAVRHTLKITLRSTLPERDMLFFQR